MKSPKKTQYVLTLTPQQRETLRSVLREEVKRSSGRLSQRLFNTTVILSNLMAAPQEPVP